MVICVVIIVAVLTYTIVVETRNMEHIKHLLVSASIDKRILLVLTGWRFNSFLEGLAWFSVVTTISAVMLVALSFTLLNQL